MGTDIKTLQSGTATFTEEQKKLVSVSNPYSSIAAFEAAQRMVMPLAKSTMVPQQYQGNIGNCMVAFEIANRIGASILMVMQNLYIVHGNPSWSSKFLTASVNSCGRFRPLKFEYFGKEGTDEWGCYAWTTETNGEDKLIGPKVTIAMSKAEGWYQKNGSKWKTMPEVMLGYRASSFWVNRYAPEISMGMKTVEEIGDIYDLDRDASGYYSVVDQAIAEATKEPRDTSKDVTQQSDVKVPRQHGELFLDDRDVIWDAALHSANKTINADGSFRKGRGVEDGDLQRGEQMLLVHNDGTEELVNYNSWSTGPGAEGKPAEKPEDDDPFGGMKE